MPGLEFLLLYGCRLTTGGSGEEDHGEDALEVLCQHLEQGGWPGLRQLRLMSCGLQASSVSRLLLALRTSRVPLLQELGLHDCSGDGAGVAAAVVQGLLARDWRPWLPQLRVLELTGSVGGGLGVLLPVLEERRGEWGALRRVGLMDCNVQPEEEARLRRLTDRGGPTFLLRPEDRERADGAGRHRRRRAGCLARGWYAF